MGAKRNACGKETKILNRMGRWRLNSCASGQEAEEGSCDYGHEPSSSMNCWKDLSGCTTGGFSRRGQLDGDFICMTSHLEKE
jgi:hypothetical protein